MSTSAPVIHATISRLPSAKYLALDRHRALKVEGTSPGEAAIGLARIVLVVEAAPEDSDFSLHVSHAPTVDAPPVTHADPPPSPQVPKLALVDLLAHASTAARIVGHLDSPSAEQLSEHVDAVVHGLSELLGGHRLSDEETNVLDDLRRLVARADALASTTDEQFSRIVVLTEGADRRGLRRLAHLVEMTASAVEAVSDAGSKLIATIERALTSERA